MKLVKVLSVIMGVLMIISGFVCLLNPQATYFSIVGYAIGAAMLFDGIAHIYAWFQFRKSGEVDGWTLAFGILSLICGIFLIVDVAAQLGMNIYVAYMAGAWLLVDAIFTIVRAFRIRKAGDKNQTSLSRNWWMILILGILMCIFAVLGLMEPTIITTAIGIFIGLGTIVAGCEAITIGMTAPATEY